LLLLNAIADYFTYRSYQAIRAAMANPARNLRTE